MKKIKILWHQLETFVSLLHIYTLSLDYQHAWLWNSWDTLENTVTCLLYLKYAENIVFIISLKTCEYKLRLQKWYFLVLRFSLSEKRKKCVIHKIFKNFHFYQKLLFFQIYTKVILFPLEKKRKTKNVIHNQNVLLWFFTIFIQFAQLGKTQKHKFSIF